MSGAGNEKLRAFLAERDVPCPKCGYNLRDLTTSTCPECGEELRLSALHDGPRVKTSPWVFAGVGVQIGLCMLLWELTGWAIKGSADGQAGFAYLIPIGLGALFGLWGMLWFTLVWGAIPQRQGARIVLTQLLWCLVAATALMTGLSLRAIIMHEPW